MYQPLPQDPTASSTAENTDTNTTVASTSKKWIPQPPRHVVMEQNKNDGTGMSNCEKNIISAMLGGVVGTIGAGCVGTITSSWPFWVTTVASAGVGTGAAIFVGCVAKKSMS